MKVIRKVKDNLFLILVAAAYIALFIIRPDMGLTSFKNSVYYIKEMILVMPVIFVLTALLDLWVPKEKILKHLGKEAKAKGVVLSLILGSISAGPIYAAFPLCVMLHKKGASIRNLVIILSAWAVIKVPMLLNEMKFLGLKFMAVRWGLTVTAIIVFSWVTAILVKDDDLPIPVEEKSISANTAACLGCGLCVKSYPDLFELRNRRVAIKKVDVVDAEKLERAADACPVDAIIYNKQGGV